jgi:hypothetical protein
MYVGLGTDFMRVPAAFTRIALDGAKELFFTVQVSNAAMVI